MSQKTDDELNKLREENFTDLLRDKFLVAGGCTLTKKYERYREAIDELEIFDDDIWVTSFPKSGTTWTQEMVWCVANDLDFEGAKENLFTRFPFLEFCIGYDEDQEDDRAGFLLDSVELVKNMPRPRFIKTHLPWELLPKQMRTFEKRPKIIHVTRNPKDACVSFFHHHKLFHGYTGNLDTFCELFMGGKLIWSPPANTIKSYWDKRNEHNVFFIKYEDMKADLTGVLKKISNFINKQLNEEDIKKLKDHLSFDKMKDNEAVNFDLLILLAKEYGVCKHEGRFIRKGEVGSAKVELTEEMLAKMDKWIETEYKQKYGLHLY